MKWHDFGKKINKYIRPATFPLAIKIIFDESPLPNTFKKPPKKNFFCQNLTMSRKYGWTILVKPEDCICLLARGVFRWDKVENYESLGLLNFSVGLYSKDIDSELKFVENLQLLHKSPKAIVISPLEWTKIEPDVVLIYGNAAQMMRLIQSYLFLIGGTMNFTSAGRIGSCHDGIVKTYLEKEPQLVILGNGDRVWGMTQDDELLFSIPAEKLDHLIKGLEKTHKAGLRYPIPNYMNFTPGFQKKFKKQAEKRASSTIKKE
ncbi:MAG: hypothetical protein GF329_19645 [Candidatus Lokiarchaeota archaeon]|nr:hypothetical protein [Candidatus Lokiarchaeota archaeon]